METFFVIAILFLSVIIHEVAHGYAAHMLNDPTARLAGRLTLNPLKHIDLMGSIIIPGLLVLSHSPFLFGWAKPVPYNPYNLRGPRWVARFGEAFVAGAGPATNIIIALLFGLLMRAGALFGFATPAFIEIGTAVVFINILLATINLIPIPPLDGSKVLASILPRSASRSFGQLRAMLEHNIFLGFALILFLIFFFGGALIQFIYFLTTLIIGG